MIWLSSSNWKFILQRENGEYYQHEPIPQFSHIINSENEKHYCTSFSFSFFLNIIFQPFSICVVGFFLHEMGKFSHSMEREKKRTLWTLKTIIFIFNKYIHFILYNFTETDLPYIFRHFTCMILLDGRIICAGTMPMFPFLFHFPIYAMPFSSCNKNTEHSFSSRMLHVPFRLMHGKKLKN